MNFSYQKIFSDGEVISSRKFNEELSKCLTDIRVAEGSGLTLVRGERQVVIGLEQRFRDRIKWLRATSNLTGGGKYNAKSIEEMPPTFTLTANFDAADIGVEASEEDCYFFNQAEEGVATHELTEDSQTPICIGVLIGFHSDNKPVYVGLSLQYNPCEPVE